MKRKHWIGVTAIGVVLALLCIVFMPWFRDDRPRQKTNMELWYFTDLLWCLVVETRQIPPTLEDVVKAGLTHPLVGRDELELNCPLVLQGKDAWGHKLVYQVNTDPPSVLIRSVGRNGRDEGGGGDDIQYERSLKDALDDDSGPSTTTGRGPVETQPK